MVKAETGAACVAPCVSAAQCFDGMITFDPAKRAWTMRERGLLFEDAAEVFAGRVHTFVDLRRDYGEDRLVTVGHLRGRMVVIVWVSRGHDRHVMSMRKANEREQARYRERLGEG